jgi:glutathione S-transferase
MYTLVIGTKNWSSWSLRPYLALRAAGAPFEEVVILLRQPQTEKNILDHSPSAKLPALKIAENGKVHTVWDSLAICETLAERHPQAHLWPSDPLIRTEARSYACEMHSGFAPLRVALSMDFARRLPTPELSDAVKADIARVIAAWEHALARHGDAQGFLFGRFSIADAMYAPVVSRFVTYGVAVPGIVRGYMNRVMALPAMQDWGHDAQAEVDGGLPAGTLVTAKII